MKLRNFLFLIAGYGMGQGSIFIAQTWLITHHKLWLVSSFGISFYIATLAIMLVDFGSTAVLARETAAQRYAKADGNMQSIWPNYFAILPIRLIAAGIAIASTVGGGVLTGEEFHREYAVCAWPALAIWAFNATGLLDGLKMSGMNGLAGAMPFIASGITLAAVSDCSPATAGAYLGASLSIGYALSLAGQLLALAWSGHPLQASRPSFHDAFTAATAGFGSLMSALPSQLYFRVQIFLAGIFLGSAGTALFLYAKQIVVGFAQVVGFLRRIEFPDLVRRLADFQGSIVREVMAIQRTGTLAATAGALVMLGGGLAAWKLAAGTNSHAGHATAIFAPVVLTSAIALSFTQALAALRLYHRAAGTIIIAVVAGTAVASSVAQFRHLEVFALADITSNAATICISIFILQRATPLTRQRVHKC